jgi:hypothetical protein
MNAPEQAQGKTVQVLSSAGNESGGYTTYSNGIVTQRMSIRITMPEMSIKFPVPFPNEVISLQILGNLNYCVIDISVTGAKFLFEHSDLSRQFKMVVSGV